MAKKDENRWAGMPGREDPAKSHRLQVGRQFRLDGHLKCRHCGKYQTRDGGEPK